MLESVEDIIMTCEVGGADSKFIKIILKMFKVECDPECQLGWYKNGGYIKTSDQRYSVNSDISYQNIYR